jgi:hypothetical protein
MGQGQGRAKVQVRPADVIEGTGRRPARHRIFGVLLAAVIALVAGLSLLEAAGASSVSANTVIAVNGSAVNASCQSDVTTTLQSYFNALPAGSSVRLAPGTCFLTTGLRLKKPVSISGGTFQDPAVPNTTSAAATPLSPVISVDGTSSVTLSGVTVTGTNTTGAFHAGLLGEVGVRVEASSNVTLNNVVATNTYGDGLQADDANDKASSTPDTNLQVAGFTTTNAGLDGVALEHVSGAVLDQVQITNPAGSGFDVSSKNSSFTSGNISITNCTDSMGITVAETLTGPVSVANCSMQDHVKAITTGSFPVTVSGGSLVCGRGSLQACIQVSAGVVNLTGVNITRTPGTNRVDENLWSAENGGQLTIAQSTMADAFGYSSAGSNVTTATSTAVAVVTGNSQSITGPIYGHNGPSGGGNSGSAPSAVTSPAGSTASATVVPSSCDTGPDGSLQVYLDSLPAGATFEAPTGACYLVTGGLVLSKPVTIVGGTYVDPTIPVANPTQPQSLNPIIEIDATSNVTLSGVTVVGTNTTGNYHARWVGQAGIKIHGSTNVTLDNVTAENTYGDGLELTGASVNHAKIPVGGLVVNGFTTANAGRQGVTLAEVSGAVLNNVSISNPADAGFDFESDLSATGSGNVIINNCVDSAGFNIAETLTGPVAINNCTGFHRVTVSESTNQPVTFTGGSMVCGRGSPMACINDNGGNLTFVQTSIGRRSGVEAIAEPMWNVRGGGTLTFTQTSLADTTGGVTSSGGQVVGATATAKSLRR